MLIQAAYFAVASKYRRSTCQKRIAYNRVNIVERIELLLLFVRIWRRTRVERLRWSKKDSGFEFCYLTSITPVLPFLNNFNMILENSWIVHWLLNPHPNYFFLIVFLRKFVNFTSKCSESLFLEILVPLCFLLLKSRRKRFAQMYLCGRFRRFSFNFAISLVNSSHSLSTSSSLPSGWWCRVSSKSSFFVVWLAIFTLSARSRRFHGLHTRARTIVRYFLVMH